MIEVHSSIARFVDIERGDHLRAGGDGRPDGRGAGEIFQPALCSHLPSRPTSTFWTLAVRFISTRCASASGNVMEPCISAHTAAFVARLAYKRLMVKMRDAASYAREASRFGALSPPSVMPVQVKSAEIAGRFSTPDNPMVQTAWPAKGVGMAFSAAINRLTGAGS